MCDINILAITTRVAQTRVIVADKLVPLPFAEVAVFKADLAGLVVVVVQNPVPLVKLAVGVVDVHVCLADCHH